jgi:hypothetical protein
MRLFSAPGSSLTHKRAWLVTPPFDLVLSESVTIEPVRLEDGYWSVDVSAGTWDADSHDGAYNADNPDGDWSF